MGNGCGGEKDSMVPQQVGDRDACERGIMERKPLSQQSSRKLVKLHSEVFQH